MNFGFGQLIIIIIIVLFFFGDLPSLIKKIIKNFKKLRKELNKKRS
jgi:Sec-independent protein translocase protein TatA